MTYNLLNPVNANTRPPAVSLAADPRKTTGISHTLSARNVGVQDHRWNFRSTASQVIFIIARLPRKTGSDGIFFLYKIAEIEKLATHRNSSDPLPTSTLIFNACAARFVCVSRSAIDCITRIINTPKIDSPVVQSVTVPVVDNPPTARRNNHIVHVHDKFFPVFPCNRPRCIKGLSFGIPPRKPGIPIQLFKVRFINKGELPLSQRDAAVWGEVRQPAQNTTTELCWVFA